MNRCKTKKIIANIIRQGYNEDTQELFNIIVEVMQEEFTEVNFPTLISFMLDNVKHSLKSWVGGKERDKKELVDCFFMTHLARVDKLTEYMESVKMGG